MSFPWVPPPARLGLSIPGPSESFRAIMARASSHRCCRFVSRAYADLARRPGLAGRPPPIPGGGGRLPSPSPRLRPRPGGFGGVRLLAGGPGRVLLLVRGLGFGGLLLLARGL